MFNRIKQISILFRQFSSKECQCKCTCKPHTKTFVAAPRIVGTKSEIKKDNMKINVKKEKKIKKSIYDIENESWTTPIKGN